MKKKFWIYIIVCTVFVWLVGYTVFASVIQGASIKSWFFSSAKESRENENVVAMVNGEEIYQNQIDMHIAFNRMQIENLPKEHKGELLPITEQEVLNKLIRSKVMLKYAKDIGIVVDRKEVEKYISESYEIGKSKNDANFTFVEEYIKEMGMSEEEYIKRATDAYCDNMVRSKLYETFCEGKSEEETVLKEKFETLIEELIKQSDVQIFKEIK